MASPVTICNGALLKLGAKRIASLGENSVEAKLCNERYDELRMELLRSHPWRFAIEWAEPALVSTPPIQKFGKVYQLPTGCLRVLDTNCPEDRWTVEGNYLSSDYDNIRIRFIKNITDANLMDENFREVLSCRLAADISYALTQNASLRGQIMEEYERRLRTARSFSAQESSPPRTYANGWLNWRRGGGSW